MKSLLTFICILIGLQVYSQKFNRIKLDSLFDYLSNKNIAMGNAAIYQNGKHVYTKNFGYRDIELRDKGNSRTLYRIGSVSDTYIATMILQLIDEDKLNLDTKIANFFPDLPKASKISIEDLLRQQSGFDDFSLNSTSTDSLDYPKFKASLLKIICNQNLALEPQKKYSYSLSNYMLLSWVIEEIEEKTLSEIFFSRIKEPGKLKTTIIGGKIRSKNNEAIPYIYEKKWGKSQVVNPKFTYSEIVATSAPELAKFYSALFEKDLVDINSLNKMVSMDKNYGMGLKKLEFRDKTVYGNQGKINGFETFILYFVNEGTSIALTTNASRIDVNQLASDIANIYFGYDYDLSQLDHLKTELNLTS